ncbi:glycosyltransferase [Candidatus Pelagibacter bacterium nBUS_36]|uniref:glycosyltransferase n=1 Tax=Candidatus Pelagibacter bacterium nBUS_36 TaxID=3374194 RepID=UPI003EB80D99
MDKKVSVIINFHNGEKFLSQCLESVLNQEYENLEVILWDNCSDDNSKKIVTKYKDNRIIYFFSKKKETLYKARNQAISKTSGDLIAFLDSDDWWEKNYISSRANLFSDSYYDYFYSNINLYYEKKSNTKIYRKYKLPQGKIFDQLSKDYFIIISGVIFKKKLFLEHGFFDDKFNIIGDYDFMMKISKFSNGHGVNLPLINYRIHDDNFSKLHSKMFFEEYKKWFEENNINKNDIKFKKNIKFFKNKLDYLEITSCLLNKKKNLLLLKKILRHVVIIEKIKFLILFFLPKKFFKFLKK